MPKARARPPYEVDGIASDDHKLDGSRSRTAFLDHPPMVRQPLNRLPDAAAAMRRAEKAACISMHADALCSSRRFSRFGEKIEQIVPRDQGYLFPIRPRDQKLLGKKLTISKQASAGAVLPRAHKLLPIDSRGDRGDRRGAVAAIEAEPG